ncbi:MULTISPECIES: thioesterase II family protein [unclassified Streptomyces]|uniref:thioesterase II family protein n=1 Tax=unclassified Streptomyces TaxID=2593676 RepID=UPI0036FDAD67
MSSVVFRLTAGRAGRQPPDGMPLVAVQHAGGTSAAFRPWTAAAHARGFALFGTRTAKPTDPPERRSLRGRSRELAESLAALGRPYVLLGHSMGGALAAETVLQLRRHAPEALPSLLVVCGTNPPQLRRPLPVPDGPDARARAVEFLRTVGGTPARVLQNPTMRELAVTMLLDDLAALRDHVWDGSPVTTPTTVYAGRTDPVAPPESVARWAEIAAPVTARVFDGGHFFPHERTAEVLDAIRLDLDGRRPAATAALPRQTGRSPQR